MKQYNFAEMFKSLNQTSIHDLETIVTLWFEIFQNSGDENTKEGREQRLDVWFENEHLITNADVFWNIATKYWVFLSIGVDRTRVSDWLKAWSRYGRMEHHFRKKLRWTNLPIKMTPADILGQSTDVYGIMFVGEHDIKSVERWFEKKGSNQYITVYRGFGVEEGQKVRKGVKRLNNKDALIQDTGAGYSYSLSKSMATGYESGVYKKYFLEKHLGLVKSKDRLKVLNEVFANEHDVHRELRATSDARSCRGTYRIRKKDIISVILNNQDEVVIEPKNVELLRYDFLTWAEHVGSTFVKDIVAKAKTTHGLILRPTNFKQDSLMRIGKKLGEVIQDVGGEQDWYNWSLGMPSKYEGMMTTLMRDYLEVTPKGAKLFDRKKIVRGRKEVSTRTEKRVLEDIVVERYESTMR